VGEELEVRVHWGGFQLKKIRLLYCFAHITHPVIEMLNALLSHKEIEYILVFTPFGCDNRYLENISRKSKVNIISMGKYSQIFSGKVFKLFYIIYFFILLFNCIKYKINLIHAHMAQNDETLVCAAISKVLRKRIIIRMLGKERDLDKFKFLRRKAAELVIRKANHLICVDKTLVAVTKKLNVPADKVTLMHNYINSERINKFIGTVSREDLKRKYGIPLNKKIILYNHRIIPFKRPLLYIDSIKEVLERADNCHFLFVGPKRTNTDLGVEIQQKIKEYAIEDSITWLDWQLNGNEIDEIYYISDIAVNISELVVPSLATLEAMSFGAALVIADAIDSDIYVKNGFNGFMVRANKDDVSDAVIKILSDESLLDTMRSNSSQLAKDKFDIKIWGEKILKIYSQIGY